ncbi:hypothetical protein [Acinetobacter pollinis]|uniref:hypothetical protein n=1 Tax=Acinetobacter pollinis TaxID=2605270 RepID=UPI0018A2E9BD|nr:hypothetical protein [Acinetobacter pollinis]MBF7689878.1 hypothetical protein [Acinetobacter pollinis]MBF7692445.1 hypothetical protein [Acinetobacter pollinis]MBF7697270.1 hypothetical protein [Acinetobacter pollinis]MBF7701147.1 hypothetical protein [Acinetobacter pollinis]
MTHPSLGPHEGNELELMLQNKKELAFFYTGSEIPDAFNPYLKTGRLHCKTIKYDRFLQGLDGEMYQVIHYIISQQPESKSGLRLAAVLAEIMQKGFCPDLEREIGRLLGYDHEDIEYYIQHCQSRR